MKISPVLAVLLLVGCAETGRTPGVGGGARDAATFCTDEDGDGYGEGCARGGDCNDIDPLVHQGCLSCVRPAEGCACDNSNKPISCYLEPSTTDDGAVMCHEGTRYCRAGAWSACESIFSYPKPAAAVQPQALVNTDAGIEKCSECRPNCFVVRDNLNPTGDAGLGDAAVQTQVSDAGGLSLGTYIVDAGTMDASTYDASACMIGAAPDKDCDGILDQYDPYPDDKPFATANPTIFLDIAAGATGTGVVNLSFYLNSADVYFLLDQTGSMGAERNNLVDGLTKGDFVNDAAYNCSDFDFDKQPNNELKSKGIIGAIRCYIREANFGIGFFRELPFDATPSGWPYSPWMYGLNDEIAFRNLQDITKDVDQVAANAAKLATRGNYDWEEAAMPGLYTLITGNGMYFGVNKSSIAPRTGCPANTFGYPCFRNDAIPIVVLFTDAPTHNGPTNNSLPYDSNYLNISKNTSGSVTEATGNETFLTAADSGDLTNSYVTFSGDTSKMMKDSTTAAFTCASSSNAPDAFFKFTLNTNKKVTITSEGSEFDTVLGLWQGIPGTPEAAKAVTGNDSFTNAYNFTDVTNKWVQATGTSSGLASDYLASDLGCSAYSGSSDVAFKFSVSQTSKIALDTAGSSLGTSISLFSGTPTLPTYTAASSSNDTLATPQSIGTINGLLKGYTGTTNAGTITANYTGAQIGCGTADASPDAVFGFTVGGSTTKRIRVTAEDSALDTVLALTDAAGTALSTSTTSTGNDDEWSSNANINLGALDGKALRLTGNTSWLSTDYSVVGCNSTSRDAVYKFTLSTPRTVVIDTNTPDNQIDTVIGLFKNSIVSSDTPVSGSNTYENLASAGYPGAIDGKHYVISGSTSGMAANYTQNQLGACTTSATSSPDAVYRLHLNAPTSVRLDSSGSSFDTVMALYSALPDQASTTISTGDTVGGPYAIGNASNRNIVLNNATASSTGTTSFAADVALNGGASCFAHDVSPDAVLSFTISDPGSYQIDTIGSGFNTVLGIYPAASVPALPTPTAASGNDLSSGAVDVGPINNTTWKSYTGSITSGMAANQANFTGCSAVGKDVYFKFTTAAGPARTITIDTMGSAIDASLGVFTSGLAPVGGSVAATYCNDNGANPGDTFTGTFAANTTYYVVLKGKTTGATGNYKITFRDGERSIAPTYCDDDSGGSGTSKLTIANLVAGNYVAVIKGKGATDKGKYKLAIRDNAWADAGGGALSCNDDFQSGSTASRIDAMNLAAGDYYVVLKGKSSSGSNYVLSMQDIGASVSNGWISCNDNDPSGGTTTSRLEESLAAGTYWVVIKGRSGASPTRGIYGIDIFDKSVQAASVIDCDYNSGSGGTSAIETDLSPGDYRVIVKGKAAGDKGNYKLQVRDVTALPVGTGRLACNYNSGSGGKSYLEQQVNAGTYTVIVKGDSATAGNYKLSIRDASNINASETPLYCNDNISYGVETSAIKDKDLTAGTYYVGIKGDSALDSGRYQVSFGAGSTTTAKYTPPLWSETLAALTAKKVRVIPILSCKDDPDHGDVQGDCNTARTQYTALANATGALGSNLKPLIYDIDTNGTGLSDTVVKGIASLAQYLEMNVSAQVVFSPDANPGFTLDIKAVDAPGDGCNGLVGVEHQNCAPGATPRFEISFTNPASSPVPRNSTVNDPNGGYNFKAQLIANGQFVVDEIPIYIIPENVVSAPPPPKVYASGTYTQGLAASGCAGKTDLPDWSDLTWNATIPSGTSVQFGLCSGANATASSTCTPTPICKITGGAACSPTSPCAAGSYCSAAGNCNTITGNACTSNANCPSQATCRSNICTFDGQPLDVGEILGAGNGEPNLKVQITLNANTTTNVGPTVADWQINYLCKSSL